MQKASAASQGLLQYQRSQITSLQQDLHTGQAKGLAKDGTGQGKAKAAAVMHTVTAELDNFKVDPSGSPLPPQILDVF